MKTKRLPKNGVKLSAEYLANFHGDPHWQAYECYRSKPNAIMFSETRAKELLAIEWLWKDMMGKNT